MEELQNINVIDQAISIVAPRKSGKSHLLTYMLLNSLKTQAEQDCNIVVSITILCQSLIDANTYFHLYIHVTLDELGYHLDTLQEREFVDNFHIRDHLRHNIVHKLTSNESDHIIKTVLQSLIKNIIKNNKCTKSTHRRFVNTRFYFNGSISPDILNKLCSSDFKSERKRKYIVIVDDVKSESYRTIKNDVNYIYEQGRHHGIAAVIVDQYIKSTKVPPEIRLTSSHLMFRAFDENIRKEICNLCGLERNQLDIENIKNLINEYYAIVIDLSNKNKLFYIKAPSDLFQE